MAHMNDLWVKKDVLETLLKTINAKGENGIALTIATNNEANQYGQNVSAWVSQKQEDKGKDKFYVGNGRVVWVDSNSNVFKPERNSQPTSTVQEAVIIDDSDSEILPF